LKDSVRSMSRNETEFTVRQVLREANKIENKLYFRQKKSELNGENCDTPQKNDGDKQRLSEVKGDSNQSDVNQNFSHGRNGAEGSSFKK
jgi:hypothetical protein